MSRSPVALFIYNRIDTTSRVFARIADARPPVLLVVADGARGESPEDAARCEAVRNLVGNPPWDCDLRLDLSPTNLGLSRRFSSGLEWVFREVEEAVILEDDCLPDPTFFPYCDELLERYRDERRVMMISGDNYQFERPRGAASYFLSHGVGTYGWATWRRAFSAYKFEMNDWPSERYSDFLREIWPVPEIAAYWRARFDETHAGLVDTWDYQWAFAMWRHRGMQTTPRTNLISYIGCLPDAVHTSDPAAPYCNVPTEPLEFPLVHPHRLERHLAADIYEFHRIFLNRSHEDSVLAERHAHGPNAPAGLDEDLDSSR